MASASEAAGEEGAGVEHEVLDPGALRRLYDRGDRVEVAVAAHEQRAAAFLSHGRHGGGVRRRGDAEQRLACRQCGRRRAESGRVVGEQRERRVAGAGHRLRGRGERRRVAAGLLEGDAVELKHEADALDGVLVHRLGP